MLGGSVHTVKENAEALIVASKEIGLEVNAVKTKYTDTSPEQNAGRNNSIKIDSSSFEKGEQFKYLGTTVRNQNSNQEEIKSRFNSRNPFCQLVKNLLSSRLLSKNLKIKIYKTTILPVVFYVCETWSLILREERRLRLFDNKVHWRIFGPKRDEVTGKWRRMHTEKLNDLYYSPNVIGVVKSRRNR
jgi:hypothetical protein